MGSMVEATVTVQSVERSAFPGWRIAWAAFVILAVAYGIQFSFGVFITPIGDDLGWSRTRLSLAYATYVGLYSLLSSPSGLLTDRLGPRKVIMIGAVILGAGWAAVGATRSLPWLYGALVIAAIGMSVSWVPCNATVVRWFVAHRGRAVGLTSSGGSFGGFVVPPLVAVLVAQFGWRTTLVIIGCGGAVIMVGAAGLMRRDPESLGFFPDGAAVAPVSDATQTGYTMDEARRTSSFWVITSVFLLTWLVVFTPFVHIGPFATDLGASAQVGAFLISAIGVGGLAGRLVIGPISDVFGRRMLLASMLAVQSTLR